ncbi:beta-ketoacyl synthase chain length factor [Glaciimonas sp. PCH181]|uniref:beta-ketoacyl synthase chain length factor n=1 Tax=Glaciimonas sp. PCH181 TaxID=2133943 RepID=UPI000D3508B0|nr:beta-ketoacyl synthase chain length factor [Glaciimonas sp. PCH181]PUA19800.1 3-oxoacyl-ACP synthase [Glaciimonas sp. PCH181]
MNCDHAINGIQFSIASQAAWAPGIETEAAWQTWTHNRFHIQGTAEPAVAEMPAMLRRRAGFIGKMALEVAYRCLNGRTAAATVFCSRHGECARSVELLQDLVQDNPLSPTSFSLSVHNATAGLLSIARHDQSNHSALSAGSSGVEHAVIEACGLLADGASEVLLVVYDGLLPTEFIAFQDCEDQPFAWAWLLTSPPSDGKLSADTITLSWEPMVNHQASGNVIVANASEGAQKSGLMNGPDVALPQPAGLEVLRFQLRQDRSLDRFVDNRHWCWRRHAE